ncbi:hypothetical protein BLNAU_8951 [Blattamonas nauphoetae]|uniref:Uncharacterized protein n=1 Tax=Blattamonas nauphoetae TaxID=2049346 RepID=A0ABQ9XXF9_9EUKA|nr:hypothetical protein BLNAU_8951 [Blattamonas nauphoetae]
MDSFAESTLLCCAVDNRPIPPCIVNKVSEFVRSVEFDFSHFMLSFSPHLLILDERKPRFAATLPLPLLCERLVHEVLTGNDESLIQCLPKLHLCSDSASFFCFIHPFIIRGLGSIILQHADKGFQATVFVLFSYLLKEARARLEWLPTSLSVSRVIPSSQIVDTATAFLQLYFDRLTRSTFLPPLLEVIAQLSAFSISTASLQSVVRFFRLLTRLLSISHPTNQSIALLILSKLCAPANAGLVLDLCRWGVVALVVKAVEASSSLDEYEMGVTILGSILQTLTLSRSIDEMTNFDFSVNDDHNTTKTIEIVVVSFGEVDGATAQRRLASDEKP